VASRLSGRSSTSPDCLPSLSTRCPLVEDGLLRRQAVRDHMTAVLGREARGTAASGNVMRVRGPALYPAPAALAADQTMSSSSTPSSRTLGTRGGLVGEVPLVVEPSASSLAGPLVARLLVSQSPRFFSRHARPCGPRCGERGSQGVQAIHPVRSPPYDGEGLFDDGGDVVVPPERSVQHRLVHCVVGPGSLSGPCSSRRRSDYVFVSDVEVDEETLGTRGGLVGETPLVVEPSASSPGGVHWSLGCSFPNPRSSSAVTLTLAGHVVARGALRGFKQSTQLHSMLRSVEGLLDEIRRVTDDERERRAVGTQAVQIFRSAVRADRTTDGIGGKADDAAEVARKVRVVQTLKVHAAAQSLEDVGRVSGELTGTFMFASRLFIRLLRLSPQIRLCLRPRRRRRQDAGYSCALRLASARSR
jgi:hypothetical protein